MFFDKIWKPKKYRIRIQRKTSDNPSLTQQQIPAPDKEKILSERLYEFLFS
jgi:hypothetical protein